MVERTKQHKKDYYYTYEQMIGFIKKVKKRFKGKFKDIYAIPRGGLVFGVYLSHTLGIPMTRKITKDTLIVDDICDTGNTLLNYKYNEKITLVGKPIGLNKNEYVYYNKKVKDNVWVHFPWENGGIENDSV
jgi:hypoxanthine phosphoribosyltransferase